MEVYDAGDAVALAHAFNPRLILLRTSFASGDAGAIWRSLLQGGRGTIVWDEDTHRQSGRLAQAARAPSSPG